VLCQQGRQERVRAHAGGRGPRTLQPGRGRPANNPAQESAPAAETAVCSTPETAAAAHAAASIPAASIAAAPIAAAPIPVAAAAHAASFMLESGL